MLNLKQIISKKKNKSFLDLIGEQSKLSIKLDNSINLSSFKFSTKHLYNDIAFDEILSKQFSLLLQHELFIESERGNVKLEFRKFAKTMTKKYQIQDGVIESLFERASDNNIIYLQMRQFTPTKSIQFVSLKVPLYFSHENFIWALKSLINDKVSF